MLKVCIGYDEREAVAYHVLCQSIMNYASGPVCFIPINKRIIPEFSRGMEDGSTEFSFSRFLTPYLSGYSGQSIFMDCDFIIRDDIYKVLDYCDFFHDVFVVKHEYTPKGLSKFLGQKQHAYPKKNWSSFMVFNNFMTRCKSLTPKIVSEASGKYLHRFEWTSEDRVGEIPATWNHLVGEYKPSDKAKGVHFTLGTPCFEGYEDQEHSQEWFGILQDILNAEKKPCKAS